eukprot:gene12879-14864_t
MFTYETDHIVDYALHSFAVNSAYAEYRNYDLVLTTSKQGFEFESRDQRWNKVKIMETFINELSKGFHTDEKEDRYLVWIDSDLIFLNFELDLSALVAQYPLANLIISADVEPLNGMVNTGCMIVRVSRWSQLFFLEWWEATDRVNGMDQHVFDLLYRRRKNTEEANTSNGLAPNERIDEKIAILPTYALNSHIPASRHQEHHHNILHLAGESSVKDGIALNTAYLAVQLGLSREVLQAIDYPAVLYSAVKVDGDTSSATENSNQHCEVEHVLKLQARLRDAMQSRDLDLFSTAQSTAAPFLPLWALYRKALQWNMQAHAEYLHITRVANTALYSPQAHLEQLQNILDASFELLTAEKDPTIMQSTLNEAARVLQVIRAQFVRPTDAESYAPVLYYQFKYFDFLAIYYHSIRLPTKELESLEQARILWEKMASFHFYGSGNTVSDPFRELAGILTRMAQVECRDDVHYFDTDSSRNERGLALVLRSVEIRASRWLPRVVFECIRNYTQDDAIERADCKLDLDSAQPPELLTAEQCKNVPIKILHILADNYALAARCAKKLTESIGSDIWDTNPVNFDPVDANATRLYRKYDHVKSQLCSVLSTMGQPCIMNNDTDGARASQHGRPVSDPSTDLSSASGRQAAGTPGQAAGRHGQIKSYFNFVLYFRTCLYSDLMPRKLTVQEILAAASTTDPICVGYLHDELKLYEPFEEIVCRLIECDPQRARVANESGSLALHIACGNIENKSVGSIKFVAEAYLDGLSSRTLDGQLPLHLALASPKVYSYSLVEMLVELNPAALSVPDKRGHYPLHKAASKANIDPAIVDYLIQHAPGVVSIKDHNGSLPLHWAVAKDQPSLEVIYQLVAAYPEGLFDPDYEGHLPYDKLMHRSKSLGDIGAEMLNLMEFTRQQNLARRLKPMRVPSPTLR